MELAVSSIECSALIISCMGCNPNSAPRPISASKVAHLKYANEIRLDR